MSNIAGSIKNIYPKISNRVQRLGDRYPFKNSDGKWVLKDACGNPHNTAIAENGICYQGDGSGYVLFDKSKIDLSGSTFLDFEIHMSKAEFELVSIQQYDSLTNRVNIFWHTNNILYFIVANGESTNAFIPFTDYGYHKFRFIYDGSGAANADKIKIYIDDVQQNLSFTGTLPSSIGTLTNNFTFGKQGGSNVFNGKLGKIIRRDSSGNIINQWFNNNNTTNTVCIDTVGDAPGRVTGALDLNNFYAEDKDFPNDRNDSGVSSKENSTFGKVVIEGDSMSRDDTYPIKMAVTWTNEYKNVTRNVQSAGGHTVPQMIAQGPSIDLLLNDGYETIVFMGGINDWYNDLSLTKETLWSRIETWLDDRVGAGWNVFIIANPPATPANHPTGWEEAREYIKDQCEARSDLAGVIRLDGTLLNPSGYVGSDTQKDQNNTIYYNTDKLHLTSAGYQVLADTVRVAIESTILSTTVPPEKSGRVKFNPEILKTNVAYFNGSTYSYTGAKTEAVDFVIEVTAKFDTWDTNNSSIFGGYYGSMQIKRDTADRLLVQYNNNLFNYTIFNSSAEFLEQWHTYKIEIIYGTSLKFYVDDELKKEESLVGATLTYVGYNINIGDNGSNNEYFKGQISHFYYNSINYNKDFYMSNGTGSVLYNKSDKTLITVSNITESTFWDSDETSEVRPNNYLDGYGAYKYFNGASAYNEYQNSGLGSGDFYYRYVGTIEKSSSTKVPFSDGHINAGGKRFLIYTDSNNLLVGLDDDILLETFIIMTTTQFSTTDCLDIIVERISDEVNWVCKNLTRNVIYSGNETITTDFSSTQSMTIGAARNFSGNIDLYNKSLISLIEMGTSSTNITHRYVGHILNLDLIGTNATIASADTKNSYIPSFNNIEDVLGNELSNPGGKWLNNSENKFKLQQIPKMWTEDLNFKFWYGNESISNGSFNFSSIGWSKTSGVIWKNGRMYFNGTGGFQYIRQSMLTLGKTYVYKFDYDVPSGSAQIVVYVGANNTVYHTISGTGTIIYTEKNTGTNNYFYISNANAEQFYIDNVSCKDVEDDTIQELTFDDINNYYKSSGRVFIKKTSDDKLSRIILYDTELTGDDLTKMNNFIS